MTSAPRQPRDRRRSGVRVEVSARDELVMRAVGRFRAVTTTSILRLVFPGLRRDTGIARLRKLYDGKLLNVHANDRMAENIYSLGPRGRAWLADRGGEAGPFPRGGLAHHLAIVELWVAVVLGVRRSPGLNLDIFRPDWIVRHHAPVGTPLIPDALVQLTVSDHGLVRLAFEVDLTTESLAILRAKIDRYETLRLTDDGLFGWQDFTLVVAITDATPTRRQAIGRILQFRWGGCSFVWSISDDLSALLTPPLTTSHDVRGGKAG